MQRKTKVIITAVSLLCGIAIGVGGAALSHKMGRSHHGERMMSHMDADSDGKVTKEEFSTHTQSRFSEMDANSDGALTPDEMRNHHKHGKMWGKNTQ